MANTNPIKSTPAPTKGSGIVVTDADINAAIEKSPPLPPHVLNEPAVSSGDAEADATVAPTKAITLEFFNEQLQPLPPGKYDLRPLSKKELDDLADLEGTLRAGLPEFLRVAQALLDIRERKLWRLYCRSFPEYCDKRLGISRAWASMQASAAEAMQNLLTNGEQTVKPTTERQLRSLAGLDAKVQVAAWNLAVTRAAGKKVTGKQVEDAVNEVLGVLAPQSEWLISVRARLTAAGYETDFQQPVDVGEKEWIDFWHEQSDVYIKLIDQPTLRNLTICLAMREQEAKCQVIVNGTALGKKKLTANPDGTLARLLDPVLGVIIHSLGAFLERDGKLYEAGELGKDSKLELKLSASEEASDLRLALDPPTEVAVPEE